MRSTGPMTYDMLTPIETDDARSGTIGQLGRVAVIGGSEDYTGAPYFSAMASARLGCDLVRSPSSWHYRQS